jgi:ADP-heptose:LPS heptosyltransferase
MPLKRLANIHKLEMNRSEVDVYMDIARDMGIPEDQFIWTGSCRYNSNMPTFDFVISNGYNRKSGKLWTIKEYPYWAEVAKILIDKGYSVCSIGGPTEYVPGTVNKTGLCLLDSLGLIKNSKHGLLSNDSGMYHCGASMEVPVYVIFTATSIAKNFDKRFHRSVKIIGRTDLECRPCQAGRRWTKDCKTWDCREIEPVGVVREILGEC